MRGSRLGAEASTDSAPRVFTKLHYVGGLALAAAVEQEEKVRRRAATQCCRLFDCVGFCGTWIDCDECKQKG